MLNSNQYKCKLCQSCFIPRTTGGSSKKFCSQKCKNKFHSYCKKYSRKLLEKNYISIEQLQNLDINIHS